MSGTRKLSIREFSFTHTDLNTLSTTTTPNLLPHQIDVHVRQTTNHLIRVQCDHTK